MIRPALSCKKFFLAVVLSFSVLSLFAADRYTVSAGRWDQTARWSATSGGSSGASVPVAGDNVYIEGGYSIRISNANAACANLSIASGSTLDVRGYNLTVGGTTTVNGSIIFTNSNSGTKTFTGLVTINGSWTNNNVNSPVNFRGGITNNGTFTAGTGIYTFNTNNQVLAGTLSIPNVTVTGITLTNNGILTVGTDLTGTGGLIQGINATLNIGGASGITVLTASNNGNTVNFNGAAQSVNQGSYYNLTTSGSGNKTMQGNTTVGGTLTLTSGALSISANTLTLSDGANLSYGTGSLTGGANSNLIIGTGTAITLNAISAGLNNFNISRNINLAADLTINGTFTLTSGTFVVAGHTLTLNGPAIAGIPDNLSTTSASTLVFGGSSSGIMVPSSVTNLGNLTVSNSNGVSLSGPLSSGTLTFTAGILNTASNLLTITNTNPGSIGGASETSFINGSLARTLFANQTNYGTPYLFPVGDGAGYRPLELLSVTTGATAPIIQISESETGAVNGDETTISEIAPRNWHLQIVSGNFTSATIRLTESGLDFTNTIGQSASQTGTYVSVGGTNIGTSITTATSVPNSSLPAYFAIGKSVLNTFYSYQSGDWNSVNTWTKDPSGSLWIGAAIPAAGDNVVILNGRTVTINQNGKTSISLAISLGGILDLKNYTTHNFGTVTGEGTLKLSSGTFPGGDFTNFVSDDGGTVEYYNLNNAGISSTQLTYNNLIISNYTASANTVFLNNATNPINYTLNGDFDLINSSTGSLSFYFGRPTASDNLINMTVNGDFRVGTGCNIRVNNFATGHSIPNPNNNTTSYPVHSLALYGNFTNNGTVRFTGLPSPVANAYYTLGTTTYSGTNYGDVQVFFRGATNNTVTLNGVTDFFRLIIEKGADQTNILEVVSSGAPNFALYGPNNQGNNTFDGGPEGYGYGAYYKALFLRFGTLKLGANINIPSLTEGGQDFNLIPTAGLWINGANVSTTVSGLNGTGYQAATLYGRLRISSGQFSTGDAAGIVLGTLGTPEIQVEGTGLLDVSQAWSQTGGTNRVSYIQTGGTANFRMQGENHAGPMLGLANANTVFTMSGGSLNFNNNTFYGGGTSYQIMDIQPQAGNYQVTGGTVNLNLPSSATVYTINTTAPIYNLNISNKTGTGTTSIRWTAPSTVLNVLNDLTLFSGSALDLGTNTIGLNIGHNFTLPSGATYTPGNNTTTFDGNGGQLFTNTGTITTGLNNLVMSNKSNVTITENLSIRGSLTINSSCFLNDQGNVISLTGNVVNSGTHTSQANGGIILNGTGAQTIGGSGSGVFGNIIVNKTSGTSSFTANQSMTGNLRLVRGILNISNYNLTLSSSSSIYDVLTGNPVPTTFGGSKMITTSGQQSDGGITKTFDVVGSFLYPVGSGTIYHPAIISFSQAPSTWGEVTVKPVPGIHPFAISGNEVLNYYWKVTSNLITGIQPGSVSHIFGYDVSDAGAAINSYITGIYNPYSWVPGASAQVDKINHNILFPSVSIIDGEYTAGVPAAFQSIKVFYSHRSGDWDALNTWSNISNDPASPDATSFPGPNDPVVIGDGAGNNHVITISANGKSVGGLQISTGSILDVRATTGHDFGALPDLKITGTGKLRIASGNFPSGDFGNFLGPDGGIVEYYTETAPLNIGAAFTLPTSYVAGSSTINITTYNFLSISPATGKNITLPNTNLTVHKDLNINISGTSAPGITRFNDQNTTRTVSISGNININNGTLQFTNGNSRAQNVVVSGDVNVASGAVFDVAANLAATNTLSIEGSLTNNGVFDMFAGNTQVCNVTFTGADNKQIKGTAAVRTDFNLLTVNKGTDRNSILDVTVNAFALNSTLSTALIITTGTFRLSSPLTTITLSTSNPFTIPISGSLSANTGTINIGAANAAAADLILQGRLEVMNSGTVNIGNGSGSANDIEYAAAGNPEINVSGGYLNVDGQIRRNTSNTLGALWFFQSGGTITVKGNNLNTSRGLFEVVNSGSRFEVTGGNLIIQRAGSITYADVLITPESSTVNNNNGGQTLTIGNAATPNSQIFKLNISSSLWNLTIDGLTQNKTASLTVHPLSVLNNLTINANGEPGTGSVFKANEYYVTIGGSLINNNLSSVPGVDQGGYQAGIPGSTQKTIFTGNGHINGTGSNLTNFADLVIGSSASTPFINLGTNSTLLVNNDMIIESGTLSDEGNTITVLGDISNSAVHSSPLVPGGGIILANGIQQVISGNGSGQFGNITINNPGGVNLVDDVTITGLLNLSGGLLYIDDYRLTMGLNSSFGGSFDSKHMVASNGVLSDGGIRKIFSGSAAGFVFPVGSNGKYHPATFTFNSTTGGSINIVPVGFAHPASDDPQTDQLNYYWKIATTGFSGLTSSTQIYQYLASDIEGNENNYHGAFYQDYTWIDYGTSVINTIDHTITITRPDLLEGEYTAGELTNYSIRHKLYSLKSGNWNDGTVWAEDSPANPPCGYYPDGNPVYIQEGHTITMNISSAFAYSVNIEGYLDIGVTSFHNLGYLTDSLLRGTGKILIQASSFGMYLFPGGNSDNFMESSGTTIELYGDTNATLPQKIGDTYKPYQNLILTGTGIKYINTEDLKIAGNLTINNGARLNNSLNNKNFFILGNWTDLNTASGGFISGTGTTGFEGNLAQTLTINNAVIENFYDLEINNASGLIIAGTGRVQVSDNLILTSGAITTNSVNSLTLTNPSPSAVTGGSITSYVNGPLRKQISNGSYFMFPVGKTTPTPRYGNLHLSDVVNSGIWESEYFNDLPPYDITSKKLPISHVSNNEYWRINGVTGGSANVRLRWDSNSGYAGSSASTRSKIRIVEWNPSGSPSPLWEYRGKVLIDGGPDAGTVATDAVINLAPGTDLHYLTIGDEGLPTATITSSLTASVCNDATSDAIVVIALTGTPPWSLTYQLGTVSTTVNNIATSPVSIVLTSASPGISQPVNIPTLFNFNVTNINDLVGTPGISDYVTTVGLTVNPVPDNTITGKTLVGTGEVVTYSTPTDASIYAWSLSSNGTPLTGNSPTFTVTWGSGSPGPYTLSLTKTAANGCQVTNSIQVTTSTTPTPVITGNQYVCAGSAGQIYSTPNVAGHDYTWNISPAGAGTIISGAGTNSITINWNGASSGTTINVREHVIASGLPGIFTNASLPVEIGFQPSAVIPSWSASSSICAGNAATVIITNSEIGVRYQVRFNTDNSNSGAAVAGNGGTITLYTSVLTSTSTFNIYAYTLAPFNCGIQLNNPATIQINVIPGMTWTGDLSNQWDLPGNWSCGYVPVFSTTVQIPDVNNDPVLNIGSTGSVNNLTIETGASLVITGGTLEISGTLTNNGILDVTDGTIEMNGTSAQTIGSSVFSGNTVKNLNVNNAAGVSLLGALNVTGILNIQAGNLSSGGFLTLVSSSTGTALIDGSGAGTVSGNITMQRYLPSAFGYKYVSSPFQASTVNEFGDDIDLGDPWPSFYMYDESLAASGWVDYITTSDPLIPLEGYAAFFGSSAVPYTSDVSGVVNNGSLSVTLYNHNRTYTQGFNLVGNPYPSPINWDAAAGWTKTNIDNALYYFKASETDEYGGRYSTYINGISSDDTVSNIIPSMQGFFVHVTSSGPPWPVTGTLTLDNNVRVTDLTHTFAKSGEKSSIPLLRLAATFEDDPASSDPMVIYFDEKAGKGFDSNLDALKLMNTDYNVPNLYSIGTDGSKMSIDALPELREDSICRIPLGVRLNRDGYIIFKLIDIDEKLSGKKIYITDMESGTENDLLDGKHYRVFLNTGEYAGRFFINLSSVATGIPEIVPDDRLFSVYSSHGFIKYFVNTDKTGPGTLSVLSLTGQVLFVNRIYDSGYNEFNPAIKNGIYIVTFVSENYRGSRKIFIDNR